MNQRFIYLLLILYCQILTIQAQPTFSKKHGLYEVKNLIVENAFRNTVFRSKGIFENVKFVNAISSKQQ